MGKIFIDSKEGIDARLDVFKTPDTNCSVESFDYVEYRPSQTITVSMNITMISLVNMGNQFISWRDLTIEL